MKYTESVYTSCSVGLSVWALGCCGFCHCGDLCAAGFQSSPSLCCGWGLSCQSFVSLHPRLWAFPLGLCLRRGLLPSSCPSRCCRRLLLLGRWRTQGSSLLFWFGSHPPASEWRLPRDPVLLPVAAALPVSLAVFVPEQVSFPFPRIGALQRSGPRGGQGFFPLPNTAVFTEPW